jgi:hypothetical protein
MVSIIMLSIVMLSIIMLSIIILSIFHSIIMLRIVVLSVVAPILPSLRQEAYLYSDTFRCLSKDVYEFGLKYHTRPKVLFRDKHSSYLCWSPLGRKRMFGNIDTRGQCYKTIQH